MARSAFIPLLIAGMVVAVLAFSLLVPITDCANCSGTGSWAYEGGFIGEGRGIDCRLCNASGKVPLLNIWRREAEEGP